MIPLRDVIPSRTTPWVTLALIAANVLMFLVSGSRCRDDVDRDFSARTGSCRRTSRGPPLVTSMFLHSGWLHLGGNLLVALDLRRQRRGPDGTRPVPRLLPAGRRRGVRSLQRGPAPDSLVPLVGASGAIAGVMGAYLVLFPHSRVLVLVFLIFFIDVIEIPAVFFLGIWFLMQMLERRRPRGDIADAASVGVLGARRRVRRPGVAAVCAVPAAGAAGSVDWWTTDGSTQLLSAALAGATSRDTSDSSMISFSNCLIEFVRRHRRAGGGAGRRPAR